MNQSAGYGNALHKLSPWFECTWGQGGIERPGRRSGAELRTVGWGKSEDAIRGMRISRVGEPGDMYGIID